MRTIKSITIGIGFILCTFFITPLALAQTVGAWDTDFQYVLGDLEDWLQYKGLTGNLSSQFHQKLVEDTSIQTLKGIIKEIYKPTTSNTTGLSNRSFVFSVQRILIGANPSYDQLLLAQIKQDILSLNTQKVSRTQYLDRALNSRGAREKMIELIDDLNQVKIESTLAKRQ